MAEMKRRIVFDWAIPADRVHFNLLQQAFSTRGSAQPGMRVTSEERRSESKILRRFKACGQPIGEVAEGEPDMRLIELNKLTPQPFELEQPEFKRLQKYVLEGQWAPGLTDVVADLEDRLETAEKVE
jgi:hypothetical protein